MKLTEGRKPSGYWLDCENLKKELNPLIEKYGAIPNTGFYFKTGRGLKCLGRAIGRYGIKKLSQDLGVPIIQTRLKSIHDERPPDYWKNWENLKKELEPLIEKYGNLPSTWVLKQDGLYSLDSAIWKYHGGIQKVREKLGFPKWPNQKKKKDEDRFNKWDDFDLLIKELKPYIEEYGTIPATRIVINKIGHQADKAIRKKHGGYVRLREKLGYPKWKQLHHSDYVVYRKVAIKHYGKFCAICGYINIVNVHHIDNNRENNSIENLIVLCPNHHAEVHKGFIKDISKFQRPLEVEDEQKKMSKMSIDQYI